VDASRFHFVSSAQLAALGAFGRVEGNLVSTDEFAWLSRPVGSLTRASIPRLRGFTDAVN
jgi:hypothetical protein